MFTIWTSDFKLFKIIKSSFYKCFLIAIKLELIISSSALTCNTQLLRVGMIIGSLLFSSIGSEIIYNPLPQSVKALLILIFFKIICLKSLLQVKKNHLIQYHIVHILC